MEQLQLAITNYSQLLNNGFEKHELYCLHEGITERLFKLDLVDLINFYFKNSDSLMAFVEVSENFCRKVSPETFKVLLETFEHNLSFTILLPLIPMDEYLSDILESDFENLRQSIKKGEINSISFNYIKETVKEEDVVDTVVEMTTPSKANKSRCNNVLTERQRVEICYDYYNRNLIQAELIRKYKVSQGTINYTIQSRGVSLGYITEKCYYNVSSCWNLSIANAKAQRLMKDLQPTV